MANESSALQTFLPSETGRLLKVTTQTLSNWRFQGKGPRWCKVGSAVRYTGEAIREYLEANTQTQTPGKRRAAR